MFTAYAFAKIASIKDDEGNFYSTTPDEFEETPVFTQTDKDHLKFIPKYS